MSSCIDDEILLKKYKIIWTKIEDLRNIELNALPVYDERYIKINKIITYGDKVCSKFRGFNLLEDDIECKSITVISFCFLLVYEKNYYLQVHLDNFTFKIENKQMTDYLDDNLFED